MTQKKKKVVRLSGAFLVGNQPGATIACFSGSRGPLPFAIRCCPINPDTRSPPPPPLQEPASVERRKGQRKLGESMSNHERRDLGCEARDLGGHPKPGRCGEASIFASVPEHSDGTYANPREVQLVLPVPPPFLPATEVFFVSENANKFAVVPNHGFD